MIPKIIHQIWFQGVDNIPSDLLEYHYSWINTHPEYTFIVWDQHMIEKLINTSETWIKELYYSYNKMIQKIDFAKYVILYVYGGIYIDMDIKCLKNLNILLENNTYSAIFSVMPTAFFQQLILLFIGHSLNNLIINNGIIFIEKNHPIMLETIKAAYNQRDTIYKHINNFLYIFYTTGPICLTNGVNNYTKTNPSSDNILLLDSSYFENCLSINLDTCVPPEHAIGIHLYKGSWVSLEENMLINIYKNSNLILFFIILFIIYYILK